MKRLAVHPKDVTKQLYYTRGKTNVLPLRVAVRVPNDSNYGFVHRNAGLNRAQRKESTASQTGGQNAKKDERTRRGLHRKLSDHNCHIGGHVVPLLVTLALFRATTFLYRYHRSFFRPRIFRLNFILPLPDIK